MIQVMLEQAADDLARGVVRSLPAATATVGIGGLVVPSAIGLVLWAGALVVIGGGVWRMVYAGPADRAAWWDAARARARAAERSPKGYFRGSRR